MSPREIWLDKVRGQIEDTVRNGGKIIVIGWKASNHDDNTRRLEKSKMVEFPKRVPEEVSQSTFVIFTRFIRHAHQEQLKSQTKDRSAFITNMGELRSVLEILTKFIPVKSTSKLEPVVKSPAKPVTFTPAVASPATQLVANDEPRQQMRSNILTPEQAFAQEFFASVCGDPKKTLSKFEANLILRKHFGEGANSSAYKELLLGVVSEGSKRVGSYRASEKLLELATTEDVEPSDPVEKARWLFRMGPIWETELAEEKETWTSLEAEFKERCASLETNLGRVAMARELLAKLGDI